MSAPRRSRHSPSDIALESQFLLSLWVHKGRSSVGVSPVFLIRMISAFVGVAEILAARRRTANRCVTRLCTSENLLSQGRQLWIVFCSLLIVAFITDALVRFTFYLWTRSAAGRDRSASYGRANRSPAHGKVLSSFLIFYQLRGTLYYLNIIAHRPGDT